MAMISYSWGNFLVLFGLLCVLQIGISSTNTNKKNLREHLYKCVSFQNKNGLELIFIQKISCIGKTFSIFNCSTKNYLSNGKSVR